MARRVVSSFSAQIEVLDDLDLLMDKYGLSRSAVISMLISERAILLKKDSIDEKQKKLPHTQPLDVRLRYSQSINANAERYGFHDFKIDLNDEEDLLCVPNHSKHPNCYRCVNRMVKRNVFFNGAYVEKVVGVSNE